jgi:hypothetical protein
MEKQRLAVLQDYTVTRRYVLSTRRSPELAEMALRMSYRSPNRKYFEVLWSRGSTAAQHRVFHRLIEAELDAASDERSRITPDNYDSRLSGSGTYRGRECYILELIPKFKNKYLLHGRAWVDVEDLAITRVEGSPVENPSFWIRSVYTVQEYEKIGPFWLAVSNRTDTQVRILGLAHLNIEYSNYEINRLQQQEWSRNGSGREFRGLSE